jgi:hypothetical protein
MRDFLGLAKNCSFPNRKLHSRHPEFPDGHSLRDSLHEERFSMMKVYLSLVYHHLMGIHNATDRYTISPRWAEPSGNQALFLNGFADG